MAAERPGNLNFADWSSKEVVQWASKVTNIPLDRLRSLEQYEWDGYQLAEMLHLSENPGYLTREGTWVASADGSEYIKDQLELDGFTEREATKLAHAFLNLLNNGKYHNSGNINKIRAFEGTALPSARTFREISVLDETLPAWVHPYEVRVRRTNPKAYETFLRTPFRYRFSYLSMTSSYKEFEEKLNGCQSSPSFDVEDDELQYFATVDPEGCEVQLEEPQRTAGTNRLIREFGNQRILRVSFMSKYLKNADVRSYYERLRDTWIQVGGCVFKSLLYKEKTDVFFAMEGPGLPSVKRGSLYRWMGGFNFRNLPNNPTKLASRMALSCLSTTTSTLSASWDGKDTPNVYIKKDILSFDHELLTDGCGLLSPDLAMRVSTELPFESYDDYPSAFQVRCICKIGGFKGMLIVDHRLPHNTIIFRESMFKFGPPQEEEVPGIPPLRFSLDVCNWSKFLPEDATLIGSFHRPQSSASISKLASPLLHREAVRELTTLFAKYVECGETPNVYPPTAILRIAHSLNQQVILILEALGVPRKVFLDLAKLDHLITIYKNLSLEESLKVVKTPTSLKFDFYKRGDDKDREKQQLSEKAKGVSSRALEMIAAGVHPSEPRLFYLLQKLKIGLYDSHFKGKILLPGSCYLYAVPDPFGELGENEVFLKIAGHVIKDVDVLITRSPCLLKNDIVRLRTIPAPSLLEANYNNLAIFSVQGKRSALSLMSGGDYDGDKVFVIWNKVIVDLANGARYPNPEPKWHAKACKLHESFDSKQLREKTNTLLKKSIMLENICMGTSYKNARYSFFEVLRGSTKIGSIGNYHRAFAVLKGVDNDLTKQAAILETKALDAHKNGLKVDIPKNWSKKLQPPNRNDKDTNSRFYPHFMQKERGPRVSIYHDEGVLGSLYDYLQDLRRSVPPVSFCKDQEFNISPEQFEKNVRSSSLKIISGFFLDSETSNVEKRVLNRYEYLQAQFMSVANLDQKNVSAISKMSLYYGLPRPTRARIERFARLWYTLEFDFCINEMKASKEKLHGFQINCIGILSFEVLRVPLLAFKSQRKLTKNDPNIAADLLVFGSNEIKAKCLELRSKVAW